MKISLVVLSLLILTTAAFAQYGPAVGYRSADPQILTVPEHPAHAGFATIQTGTSLYPGTSYTSAQGDRPPSDFPQAASVPLGDIARALKKEHALAKKSTTVWVNQ